MSTRTNMLDQRAQGTACTTAIKRPVHKNLAHHGPRNPYPALPYPADAS